MKRLPILFLLMASLRVFSQSEFIDTRDGNSYPTIALNDLLWFQQNLQFQTDSSRYYDDSERSKDCGQFYPLEDAFEVCPAGWRLPTESEVKELVKLNKKGKIDLIDTLKVDMCGRMDYGKSAKQGDQNTYWIQVELEGTYTTHWHFFPDEIKMHHHNVDRKRFPVRCVREVD